MSWYCNLSLFISFYMFLWDIIIVCSKFNVLKDIVKACIEARHLKTPQCIQICASLSKCVCLVCWGARPICAFCSFLHTYASCTLLWNHATFIQCVREIYQTDYTNNHQWNIKEGRPKSSILRSKRAQLEYGMSIGL